VKDLLFSQMQKEAFFQSGKGFVEMFGVLSIMAVLSIGGISGYTVAMSMIMKNRFIDAFQEVILQAEEKPKQEETDAFSGRRFSNTSTDSLSSVDISQLQKAAVAIDSRIIVLPLKKEQERIPYRFFIEFKNLPSSLCQRLLKITYDEPVCIDDGGGYMYNITEDKEEAFDFCAEEGRSSGTTRLLFRCGKK
jgi:hypothetical protein